MNVEEIKVMDYQRYQEYIQFAEDINSTVVEMGKYDDLAVAVEQSVMISENPSKLGYPQDCTTEIIRVVEEVPHDGGNEIQDIGYVVLLNDPSNGGDKDDVSLKTEKEDDDNIEAEMRQLINDWNDAEVGITKGSKSKEKQSVSHSEQRDNEDDATNVTDETFPPKKGRGKHPNSQKNLKPYKKGQSGNPSGRPVKTEQFKEVLDWWGDLTDYDNWSWDSYTNRQMVVKGIWRRATKGNRQDLDILLSLGLLDSDKFKD